MARTLILIPHFNNGAGLRRSLSSISEDTAADVMVVDDGSDEDPIDPHLVRSWHRGLGTARTIQLDQNRGIESALNAGLRWATGQEYEYIARLDCGDRNIGRRIALQEAFLDSNPDVVLLGGAALFVSMAGEPLYVRQMPQGHEQIMTYMLSNSAFIHPTVMFRADSLPLVGEYPTDFPAAEDYAWFWRFSDVGKLANLEETLIEYEVDPRGISNSRRRIQINSRLAIQILHNDGTHGAKIALLRSASLLALPDRLSEILRRRLRGDGMSGRVRR